MRRVRGSAQLPDSRRSTQKEPHSGNRTLQGTADNTAAIGERFWQLEKSCWLVVRWPSMTISRIVVGRYRADR